MTTPPEETELPRHDEIGACPKCGTPMIEHHRVRYHEDAMPWDLGLDPMRQESCAALMMKLVIKEGTPAPLGEHLCHLCDVCGYGWVSKIAGPVDG
jgi:hypothetical protein